MARDYARIMTAIWSNPKFVALSESEQRAYLLLITQPDISAAGVLRMWVPRWAEMSSTSTPDDFNQALKGLEARHFIVLDLTYGELFIRSFIKWDAGYSNMKRKPVIRRARDEVRSARIREYLDVDFVRFGLDEPPPGGGIAQSPDRPSTSTDDNVDRASDGLSGPNAPDPAETPSAHVDRPSDRTSTCDGVVVAYPHSTTPHSATHSDADASAAERGLFDLDQPDPPTINAGSVTARWSEAFTATGAQPTSRQRGQAANEAKQLLDAGNEPELVLRVAAVAGAKRRQNLLAELALDAPQPQRGRTRTALAVASADAAWDELEAELGSNIRHLNVRSEGA